MAWLQLNFGLPRTGQGPAAAARVLLRTLRDHRATDGGFWFQRKPPDVRLRVRTERPKATFTALWGSVRKLKEQGVVTRFFRSEYEPESFLFGGPAGTEAAHDHFCQDTLAWLDADAIGEAPAGIEPSALQKRADLLEAILDDLFLKATEDVTEVWDTWCRLEARLAALGAPEPARAEEPPSAGLITPASRLGQETLEALAERSSVEAAGPLRAWGSANQALASALRAAEEASRLRAGRRSVLVSVATFTANRHGLDGAVSRKLATDAAARRNPHAGARSRGGLP